MNANTTAKRQALRTRTRTQRAAARITRNGAASLATHALAAGLDIRSARTVASSLRTAAKKLAIVGIAVRVHAGRHMRNATHYSPAQVALIAAKYSPRKPAYKVAAARLALAA